MARSNNNATNGLRGQVDQFVWKGRAGSDKTFTSKVPDMSHIIPSEGQQKCRKRFKWAAHLATAKLTEPGMYEYYKAKAKPWQTAYIVAWKEFYQVLKNRDDLPDIN
jgi:hypothetical protein